MSKSHSVSPSSRRTVEAISPTASPRINLSSPRKHTSSNAFSRPSGSPPSNFRSRSHRSQSAPRPSRKSANNTASIKEEPSFLNALENAPVPSWLLTGVPVIRVDANGKTTHQVLTLSKDKFTVRLSDPKTRSQATPSSSPPSRRWFSLTRSQSNQSDASSQSAGDAGNTAASSSNSSVSSSFPNPLASFLENNNNNHNNNNHNNHNNTTLVVDIAEMDRIQRGQATQQFEKAKLKTSSAAQKSQGRGVLARLDSKRSLSQTDTDSVADESVVTAAHALQFLDPLHSFSIIFRGGAQTLDFLTTDPATRDPLCHALESLLESFHRAKVQVAADVRLLRFVWLHAVKNAFCNVQTVGKILQQINYGLFKPKELAQTYDKFGKVIGLDSAQRRKGLTFRQLADFLHYLRRNSWIVKPVNQLWGDLFGEYMNNGKPRLTVSNKSFLTSFLHKKQGHRNATLEQVNDLFAQLHALEIAHSASSTTPTDRTRITKDQFEAYLYSTQNDAFDVSKEDLDMRTMQQPLSEYFINSSHNTYLIGDQYTSASRVEMYSNALYRGCRCLELDIWDGSSADAAAAQTTRLTPVVWHGHTMTSKILFVDIIRTIKVFLNFHPDSFPIILSFENHCSLPYQKAMAHYLTTILKESLYIPPEDWGPNDPLPSPAQLRGRVVIKGRRPPTNASTMDRPQPPRTPPMSTAGTMSTTESTAGQTTHTATTTLPTLPMRHETSTFASDDYDLGSFEDDEESGSEYYDSDSDDEDELLGELLGEFIMENPVDTPPDEDQSDGEDKAENTSSINAANQQSTVKPVSTPSSVKEEKKQPDGRRQRRRKDRTAGKRGVAPELARLTLFHGTKFKKWADSCSAANHHMHSFTEHKVRRNALRHKYDFIRYNQNHMSRTYPAGSRVDSSNYNPLTAWSCGCQMVALNFQTEDAFLRLNDGRFRENGNCGYVLKPSSLMKKQMLPRPSSSSSSKLLAKLSGSSSNLQPSFDESEHSEIVDLDDHHAALDEEEEGEEEAGFELPLDDVQPATRLTIQVLSGNCLPKPKGKRTGDCIDPYVRLAVFDVNSDGKETITEFSTSPVKMNGFFPVWVQERFKFQVENWAVAMLQITVLDNQKDDFIASCSIPISCLRRGIRSVKLYDATNALTGAFDFASLLLDVGIRQIEAEI